MMSGCWALVQLASMLQEIEITLNSCSQSEFATECLQGWEVGSMIAEMQQNELSIKLDAIITARTAACPVPSDVAINSNDFISVHQPMLECERGYNSAVKSVLGVQLEESPVMLEAEVFAETVAESRGARDDPGVRDQWESTEHIGQKFYARSNRGNSSNSSDGSNGSSSNGSSAGKDGLEFNVNTTKQMLARITARQKEDRAEMLLEKALGNVTVHPLPSRLGIPREVVSLPMKTADGVINYIYAEKPKKPLTIAGSSMAAATVFCRGKYQEAQPQVECYEKVVKGLKSKMKKKKFVDANKPRPRLYLESVVVTIDGDIGTEDAEEEEEEEAEEEAAEEEAATEGESEVWVEECLGEECLEEEDIGVEAGSEGAGGEEAGGEEAGAGDDAEELVGELLIFEDERIEDAAASFCVDLLVGDAPTDADGEEGPADLTDPDAQEARNKEHSQCVVQVLRRMVEEGAG
jgi:hypothetical protein